MKLYLYAEEAFGPLLRYYWKRKSLLFLVTCYLIAVISHFGINSFIGLLMGMIFSTPAFFSAGYEVGISHKEKNKNI